MDVQPTIDLSRKTIDREIAYRNENGMAAQKLSKRRDKFLRNKLAIYIKQIIILAQLV